MRHEKIIINERAELETYLLDNTEELRVIRRPAVFVFPGGGYMNVSDREKEQVAIAYNNIGFNAFTLKYTVNKGFFEAYKDAVEAFEYVVSHKEEYAINKIVTIGFSAGAHLSCALAALNDIKPDGMMLIYPPLINKEWQGMCPSAIDLLDKINEKTPKAFIVHAYDDPLVPVHNAYMLMEMLDKAHVEFEAHIYRAGGHGFSLATKPIGGGDPSYNDNPDRTWFNESVRWIKDVVGDIEFIKREVINEEDVPPLLKKSINTLLENEKYKAVLLKEFPSLLSDNVLGMIGDYPLNKVLIGYADLKLADLINLAQEMEK